MAKLTHDQFKAAIEDYVVLSAALARVFPGEISENLLAHLDHAHKNPCGLTLLQTAVEAASARQGSNGVMPGVDPNAYQGTFGERHAMASRG